MIITNNFLLVGIKVETIFILHLESKYDYNLLMDLIWWIKGLYFCRINQILIDKSYGLKVIIDTGTDLGYLVTSKLMVRS